MKKIIIGLIGAFSLTGCHIYKNYERPAEVVVSDSLFRLTIPLQWPRFHGRSFLPILIYNV